MPKLSSSGTGGVLVSGEIVNFFLVSDAVLWFEFNVRIRLVTH